MSRPPVNRAGWRALGYIWLGLLVGFAIGAEWIRSRPAAPTPSGGIDLVGAGATFPYPLYRRWFAEYGATSGARINYYSVGSAEGIRLLLEDSTDFGAADRPLLPAERARATCGPIDIPTVLGAVVVAYNLPSLTQPVRLDAAVLTAMFGGRITRWDAPELRVLNPELSLPPLAIVPVQRARPTGTSAVFERYLATAAGSSGPRGAGMGLSAADARVEGNEGVTASIRSRAGAIGVVEHSYAMQARLDEALLRNASGAFVPPTAATIRAAAAEVLTPGTADTLSGVVGARDAMAYPVVALTRIMADVALGDSVRGAHFVAFAKWALREGADIATDLGYAPLPDPVTAQQLRRLEELRPGVCPMPRARP